MTSVLKFLSLEFFHHFNFRYYINYKLMKKKVKQYVQQNRINGKDRQQVLKEFSRMLDDEVLTNSYTYILLIDCQIKLNNNFSSKIWCR
jgi:hypothetical protein